MNSCIHAKILHIEDNIADIEYAQDLCEEFGCGANFEVVMDGQAAIERLRLANEDPDQCPDLILLDLNLPAIKGHEILGFIRAQPNLVSVPVVVLTSSSSVVERDRSMALGATRHDQKPTGLQETRELIRQLEQFLPVG